MRIKISTNAEKFEDSSVTSVTTLDFNKCTSTKTNALRQIHSNKNSTNQNIMSHIVYARKQYYDRCGVIMTARWYTMPNPLTHALGNGFMSSLPVYQAPLRSLI